MVRTNTYLVISIQEASSFIFLNQKDLRFGRMIYRVFLFLAFACLMVLSTLPGIAQYSGKHGYGNSFGSRDRNTFGSGLNSDDYHAPGAQTGDRRRDRSGDNGSNPYLRNYSPPAPPPGVPASYFQAPPDQTPHYNPSALPAPNVGGARKTRQVRTQTPNPNVPSVPRVTKPPKRQTPALPRIAPVSKPTVAKAAVVATTATAAGAAASATKTRALLPPSSDTTAISTASKKFDYSNSTNLDSIKSINKDITVRGSSFDIKGEVDWNRVRDGALRGGAIGGLIGLVVWLAMRGLTMMTGGGSSSGPRPTSRSAPPSSGAVPTTVAVTTFVVVIGVTTWMSASSTTGKPSEVKLVPVHSNEFAFKVLMPEPYQKLYVKMNDTQTLGGKSLYYYAVEFDRKDVGCVCGYAKLPPLPASTPTMTYYFDTNKALDGATKGSIERIGGIIKFQCPISLNGKHPGREAEGTLPKDKGGGLFRQRIYISGGNYYQVAVFGNPDWVNSNDAFKFLDSFDLIVQQ